jgi:drug/metabolite transporter (DMT)-like permease
MGYHENSSSNDPGDCLLSNAISTFANPLRRTLTRRESIGLVFCCTFIGAAAQVLMKIGAHNLPAASLGAIFSNPLILLLNFALVGGLSLYGLFTLLLIFALRDGELSIIYPIIALNYVWVTFLSLILFHESMNPFKACGIAVIVFGVMVLGRSGGR